MCSMTRLFWSFKAAFQTTYFGRTQFAQYQRDVNPFSKTQNIPCSTYYKAKAVQNPQTPPFFPAHFELPFSLPQSSSKAMQNASPQVSYIPFFTPLKAIGKRKGSLAMAKRVYQVWKGQNVCLLKFASLFSSCSFMP